MKKSAKLALTGAIKDQLVHLDDLAIYGLDFCPILFRKNQRSLWFINRARRKLAPELLMDITAKRGYKEDYDRGSELVVHDIRQGKLGRYTLDRCEEMEQK